MVGAGKEGTATCGVAADVSRAKAPCARVRFPMRDETKRKSELAAAAAMAELRAVMVVVSTEVGDGVTRGAEGVG